jgi:hypothetical protein
MHGREYFRYDDNAASRLAPKSGGGRFNFYVAVNERSHWFDLE